MKFGMNGIRSYIVIEIGMQDSYLVAPFNHATIQHPTPYSLTCSLERTCQSNLILCWH